MKNTIIKPGTNNEQSVPQKKLLFLNFFLQNVTTKRDFFMMITFYLSELHIFFGLVISNTFINRWKVFFHENYHLSLAKN